MIEVSFSKLLETRRKTNNKLYIEQIYDRFNNIISYVAYCSDKYGMCLTSQIDIYEDGIKTDNAQYLESVSGYWNSEINIEEFRFRTHDFSLVDTWDGRTNGDPAKSWSEENGAVTYDDVSYSWLNSSGGIVAYLDTNQTPSVWRDFNDNIIVQYISSSGEYYDTWRRLDTYEDVTSSRWSIIPYPGTKMEIREVWITGDNTTIIQPSGYLHFEAYSYLPDDYLFEGFPAGVYKVKDYIYRELDELKSGANIRPIVEGSTKLNHSGPVVTLGYDYMRTTPHVLDSLYQQRLDIVIDNNKKFTDTYAAYATFIGLKFDSF